MAEIKDNPEIPAAGASKSQRRRDALELKALAARLIALGPARLARLPLEADIRAAVEEARRIRSNVARKRQLQFVAKLLRRCDVSPVTQALEDLDSEARQLKARQHRAEAWRDYLLDGGDKAVGRLVDVRRDADAQALRQTIRNARREQQMDKPPAAARALFRMLRELDESEALPPLAPL